MPLNIIVLVKSVPDAEYYDKIKIDPVRKTLVRKDIPTVIGEADKNAIEAALRLKENNGGKVTILSMGSPEARAQLLEALALGADEAILISDRRVAGADTLATSYTLSRVLAEMDNVDLVLAGNESDDGATAHVPSQLGEWLDISHIIDAIDIEYSENGFVVSRKFDHGVGVYHVKKPCVVSIKRGSNHVRYANIMGMVKAKSKPFTVVSLDELKDVDMRYMGLDGSPSRCGELLSVEFNRDAELLDGTADEIADSILKQMKQVVEIG